MFIVISGMALGRFRISTGALSLAEASLASACRESGCGDACLKYHAAVDEPLDSL